MNPVRGHTMLNFLEWVSRHHSEIRQLRGLPKKTLIKLVNEFEGGALSENKDLAMKWMSGFHLLFETESDWQGYDIARRELARHE